MLFMPEFKDQDFSSNRMDTKTIALHPFIDNSLCSSLSVNVELSRTADFLYLKYRVHGCRERIVWPPEVLVPQRLDNLWESTCFELFIKPEGSVGYFEFNLSPNGCWNMYRFEEYRKGMAVESILKQMSSELHMEDGETVLRSSFALAGLVKPDDCLLMGISCVFQHTDGTKSYWAAVHPSSEPDFHHPDSFCVNV